MLGKDLSVALGGISDAKIAAAAQVYTRKKNTRILLFRIAAMAATLAILLTAALWPWKNGDGQIVSAPGIMKVYACEVSEIEKTDFSKLEDYRLLENSINASAPIWVPFMSGLQGLAFTPLVDEPCLSEHLIQFKISTNYGDMIDRNADIHGKKVTVQNGSTIYWDGSQMVEDCGELENIDAHLATIGRIYIDLIILADDHIVGCAVFEMTRLEDMNIAFTTKLLSTVYYPKVNDEFQKVTMEYVQQEISNIKSFAVLGGETEY